MASAALKRLLEARTLFGGDAPAVKSDLLTRLERAHLSGPREVGRLHEALCFLRAYPDDAVVLAQAERMLGDFPHRKDLRRGRRALADSGIAGTDIHYPFFWFTARWLTKHWPAQLSVDWPAFGQRDRLPDLLPLLLPYSESPAFDEFDLSPREWIETLKGPEETDAVFLVRRFERMRAGPFIIEKIYEDLDLPLRLSPGPGTPSRTSAKLAGAPVVFQTSPLSRLRPDLRREVRRAPEVRAAVPAEARRILALAKSAMVTRGRDIDAFEHGDPHGVKLAECGGGLLLAFIGMVPERRLLLESNYGYLMLKNGVPIGYGTAACLFNSAEIAFNTFESFRGAETALNFSRVLAAVRALFGADCFSLDPYQLGTANPEALRSGAWWFYQKLGFRPLGKKVRGLMNGELKKMKRDSRHRSDLQTLKALSSESLFLRLKDRGKDVLGALSVGELGSRISQAAAGRCGADREAWERKSRREASRLLGLRAPGSLKAAERLTLRRWSPLILILPGVGRWSPSEKRGLIEVVKAKAGRDETAFVRLFDSHRKLRRAVLAVCGES